MNEAKLPVDVLGARRLSAPTLIRLRKLAGTADCVIAHGSSTLPASAIAGLGLPVPFVYRQISDSLFWASTFARRSRSARPLWAAGVVACGPARRAH